MPNPLGADKCYGGIHPHLDRLADSVGTERLPGCVVPDGNRGGKPGDAADVPPELGAVEGSDAAAFDDPWFPQIGEAFE